MAAPAMSAHEFEQALEQLHTTLGMETPEWLKY